MYMAYLRPDFVGNQTQGDKPGYSFVMAMVPYGLMLASLIQKGRLRGDWSAESVGYDIHLQ